MDLLKDFIGKMSWHIKYLVSVMSELKARRTNVYFFLNFVGN